MRSTKSIAFREIVLLAIDSFRLNQIRFALTALGQVIGTASLTWRSPSAFPAGSYVLTSIQNIGTNLIWAEYAGSVGCQHCVGARLPDGRRYARGSAAGPGYSGCFARTQPASVFYHWRGQGARCPHPWGGTGVCEHPRLYLIAGRFFDQQDSLAHSHAALVTEKFAAIQFGSPGEAIGKTLAISGVPFVIIGVFASAWRPLASRKLSTKRFSSPTP